MRILKPKFWDEKRISFYSIILLPFSFVYSFFVFIKYIFYKKKTFPFPIICVGNVYVGGTGKTPVSIKIFEILNKLKKKPVVVKKKYSFVNDEILLIRKYCNILSFNKRIEALNKVVEKGFDIVILDDGYQEFNIKKDLSIICFNERQMIGNGQIIPAGPLRHNLKYIKYSDIILINGSKDLKFENMLKKYNSNLIFLYYKLKPYNLPENINDEFIAFAGIGNPSNFFEDLKKIGLKVIKEISFPDHHEYSEKKIFELIDLAKKKKAKLITTEKDFLRINREEQKNFIYLPVEVVFENEELLKQNLRKFL
tara:strand:- start:10825 stop:11754 length:930 start_codon:yes stop_codon:yes gene_type:complete